jgi:hypothetical protein
MLVLLVAGASACAACTRHRENAVEDPVAKASDDADDRKPASKRSANELIVGRWLMQTEEPADGQGGFFEQRRRLLEVSADGTFHVENYVESNDDRWQLDGTTLTLGKARVQLEEVDEQTLVLVEDLPEIYLRDGPPRRVRNTYRRLSESELGPMLGQDIDTSTPTAGAYSASYDFAMNKLPTMEITIDRHILGAAKLVLADDGTVEGCFGVANERAFSESKYSSRDGKHHSTREVDRHLFGVRGEWNASGADVLVTATRFWKDSCATSVGDGDIRGPVELHCTAIASNDALPVATLACRVAKGDWLLNDIAINPADTERAGPYTLQEEPMGRVSTDAGRPWLMLGSAPGLHVKSEDGRRTHTPEVSFRSTSLDFVEATYIDPADPRP